MASEPGGERQSLSAGDSGHLPNYAATSSAVSRGGDLVRAEEGALSDHESQAGVSRQASHHSNDSRDSAAMRALMEAEIQENVRAAVTTPTVWHYPGSMVYLVIALLLLLGPQCVMVAVEIRSWVVWLQYGSGPCDKLLGVWLLIRNVLVTLCPRMPVVDDDEDVNGHRHQNACVMMTILVFGWLGVGCYWTHTAQTCPETNPELFRWTRFVAIATFVLHIFYVFTPALAIWLIRVYHHLVDEGYLKSPNAALDGTIDLMRVVDFDAELRLHGDVTSCACCMDDFSVEQHIVSTPCDHYFHHECLSKWLALARTCPMCRRLLDHPNSGEPCSPGGSSPRSPGGG